MKIIKMRLGEEYARPDGQVLLYGENISIFADQHSVAACRNGGTKLCMFILDGGWEEHKNFSIKYTIFKFGKERGSTYEDY